MVFEVLIEDISLFVYKQSSHIECYSSKCKVWTCIIVICIIIGLMECDSSVGETRV